MGYSEKFFNTFHFLGMLWKVETTKSERVLFCLFSRVRACILSHSAMSDSETPIDYSLPGSSVHGIYQVRKLKWNAISSSSRSSRPRDQIHVS